MQITVVHPDALREAPSKRWPWIYADSDESIRCIIERELGAEMEAITPRDFQAFARSVRDQVINAMDSAIPRAHADEWVLTPLHRNPFASDLLLHVIWIEFLRQYHPASSGIVVVSRSIGLLKGLESISVWDVQCGVRSWFLLNSAYLRSQAYASIGFFVDFIRLAARMVLSRLVIKRADLNKGLSAKVVIDSFLYDSDLTEDGQYRSSHMPGLVEWYREKAIGCLLIVCVYGVRTSGFWQLYRKMVRSEEVILPFERVVTGFDLLNAVKDVLGSLLRARTYSAYQSCASIVRMAEYAHYGQTLRGLYALLYKYLPHRLVSLGVKPKLLLDWFENQPLDRALAIGVRETGAAVRHIAFRPYIVAGMHTYLYTSVCQRDSGACPQEHWVSGEGLRSMLQETDPDALYRIVPALRYDHLWQEDTPVCPSSGKPILLVLLSHSLPESIAVLEHVFSVAGLSDHFQLVIKSHKNIPVRVIREWCESHAVIIDGVRWEKGSLSKAIKEAEIVISTGTGSVLEALCYGIPVIIIGRRAGLTMNPLTGLDQRMWAEVYSPEELHKALSEWLPQHPLSREARIGIGHSIREKHFCPIIEEEMSVFGVSVSPELSGFPG